MSRPSNAERRLNLHAQVDAIQMHARALGVRLPREAARNLLEDPGDPVARLRLMVEAQRRRLIQEGR
jgi:hypothetical protein